MQYFFTKIKKNQEKANFIFCIIPHRWTYYRQTSLSAVASLSMLSMPSLCSLGTHQFMFSVNLVMETILKLHHTISVDSRNGFSSFAPPADSLNLYPANKGRLLVLD